MDRLALIAAVEPDVPSQLARLLNWITVVGLFASIASLILAVVAIVLAILFYRMSTVQAANIQDAANQISEGVKVLKELFGSLHTETFALLRENITDIRQRALSIGVSDPSAMDAAIEAKSEEKAAAIRERLSAEITQMVQAASEQRPTTDMTQSITAQADAIISRAIAEAREADRAARTEGLRLQLIESVFGVSNNSRVEDFVLHAMVLGLSQPHAMDILARLIEQGIVEAHGDIDTGNQSYAFFHRAPGSIRKCYCDRITLPDGSECRNHQMLEKSS